MSSPITPSSHNPSIPLPAARLSGTSEKVKECAKNATIQTTSDKSFKAEISNNPKISELAKEIIG